MIIEVTYKELEDLIKSSTKIPVKIAYLAGDKLQITCTPHPLIGEIQLNVNYFYQPISCSMNLIIQGVTPGVDSIIDGLTILLFRNGSKWPFLSTSRSHFTLSLKQIPQLQSVLDNISVKAITAEPNLLTLDVLF